MSTRVKGAMIIGVALVAAALLVAQYQQPTPSSDPQPVVAESPSLAFTSPIRQPIAVADSNGDGVPDWQELLNKTEPLSLSATSTFTPPETITEQFALDFFETYVRNEGFGAFARPAEEIVAEASDDLVAQSRDQLYTEQDITFISSTPENIRRYANAVASIMSAHPLPDGARNEVLVLEDAIAKNDASILTELDPLIVAYDSMVTDMLGLEVPTQMVKEHLDLTNAYQALETSLVSMRNTFADPLPALLRIQRYEDDATGLARAVSNLFTAAYQAGANFQPDDSTLDVVKFE